MEESAQGSKRVLAGLKSHKLNALNGLLTHGVPRNGHDGAKPPPSANRLDVIKAYAADCALPVEDAPASQIAQRFAPRPGSFPPADEDRISTGPLAPPLLALASGVRTLAAALIAVALLPNLVLAGLLWYGAIEPRWPSVTEKPAPVLEARAPEMPASQMQAPQMQAPQMPAPQMPRVQAVTTIPIPPIISGDGDVTAALPSAAARASDEEGPDMMPARDAQAAEAIASEEELAAANLDEAPQAAAFAAPSEPVPLPTRRPTPPSADDADASWIKPTAYVNLRAAPSSGASVVAVIAKGTKLRVVARKRGWVQATDPATSKTGWVYSGNVAAAR